MFVVAGHANLQCVTVKFTADDFSEETALFRGLWAAGIGPTALGIVSTVATKTHRRSGGLGGSGAILTRLKARLSTPFKGC